MTTLVELLSASSLYASLLAGWLTPVLLLLAGYVVERLRPVPARVGAARASRPHAAHPRTENLPTAKNPTVRRCQTALVVWGAKQFRPAERERLGEPARSGA
jgi:hypothetical protein